MVATTGYDLTFSKLNSADPLGSADCMVLAHRQQDITPSSARRSDGDTRFQLIPSESYWSQSDHAGGYGRVLPSDPTLYWGGTPVDTTEGRVIRAAYLATQTWSGSASAGPVAMVRHLGIVYVAVNDGGTGKLYSFTPSGPAMSFITNLAANGVTSLCSFRGDLWIAYGTASDVQKWDGATLTTPAPTFKAQVLCAYSSMLFYLGYDSTTKTWRVNRYDPENTGAVAALAIVPRGVEITDYVRNLVAIGPDLFILCSDALWKFTSANGNAGTLVGPVDQWVASGGTGMHLASGYPACAFQGALVYGVGATLRRHQPGGSARQIWPVAPNLNNASGNGSGDSTGSAWCVGGLVAAHDRLYAVMCEASLGVGTTTVHTNRLLCWTGLGMHYIANHTVTYSGGYAVVRPLIAADDTGYIVTGVGATNGYAIASGSQLATFGIAGSASRLRATSTTWASSILDFGLYDLDKVIFKLYCAATVPNTSTYGVALYLIDKTTNTIYTLSQSGAYSTTYNVPKFLEYNYGGAALIGKLWQIQAVITCPAAATTTPEIHVIAAVPNPVYPVRYGFRLEIPVGTHVRNHAGDMAYANQAAVDAALTYFRARRASSQPFFMDYVDGALYSVRCNTISIVRDMLRPTESAWKVTLDLQQVG